MTTPKICCICGYKNSGKTTLMTKLVRHLTNQGLAVGTVKHDGHDFEIDHEGTDSHAHKQAGAKAVALFSNKKWAFIRDGAPSIEELLSLMGDLDVILIEGLKDSNLPKIVIIAEGEGPVSAHNIRAFACDAPSNNLTPCYSRDDIDALSQVILSLDRSFLSL